MSQLEPTYAINKIKAEATTIAEKPLTPADVPQQVGSGIIASINNILMRILAVFAATGLSVIGAGSIFGIKTLTAVLMAGTLGVAKVVEGLARGFMDDGKLTIDEINAAFTSVDNKTSMGN
jgi:hypothetical protein